MQLPLGRGLGNKLQPLHPAAHRGRSGCTTGHHFEIQSTSLYETEYMES